MTDHQSATNPPPEAVTVYLWPEQQLILEELKLKLRRHGLKTSKSQLVRLALKLLTGHDLEQLMTQLSDDHQRQ